MKSFLSIILILALHSAIMAQGGKDGVSREGLYNYKEKPFEAIVTLSAIDSKSDRYKYCNLLYKFLDTQGKTIYVIYSPSDVPSNRTINMNNYLGKKIKLKGKFIEFEPSMEQVAMRFQDPNPCRKNAVYVEDILTIK